VTVVRYLCLGLPLVAVLAAVLTAGKAERDRGARAAALLAFIAAGIGLAALNELAHVAGWHWFAPVDGRFRGMPVDLWIGWAALWGPLPVLLRHVLPLPVGLGLLLWVDVAAMPTLDPLVHLGPSWWVGEVVGLVAVALPAQLLGRWTAERRHLKGRVLLQLAACSIGLLWLVPSVAFEFGDGAWPDPTSVWLFPLAQLGFLVAGPGLAAVREFAARGDGTPFPWDPPRRLVTTGPYAYVANPMQLSAIGLILLTAVASRSAALAVVALSSIAFAIGVARPHEDEDLRRRFADDWTRYRRHVRAWWPRWRPYRPDGPAVLWLDEACRECQIIRDLLARRNPVALVLRPAHDLGRPIRRARYADGGSGERGVAAVGRAFEHVDLGWAYVGWLVRLPGIGWLAQLVTDALIAAPHTARPRCHRASTMEPARSTQLRDPEWIPPDVKKRSIPE
jgi:protein-S-isoprenylcysteine O-methyltransferase Ste14